MVVVSGAVKGESVPWPTVFKDALQAPHYFKVTPPVYVYGLKEACKWWKWHRRSAVFPVLHNVGNFFLFRVEMLSQCYQEGAMIEVCPFLSMYFLIEKRHLGCTATCPYRCIGWRWLKRNFIPFYFFLTPVPLLECQDLVSKPQAFSQSVAPYARRKWKDSMEPQTWGLVQEWAGAGEKHIPVTQSACRT